jgi:hypothetical protein
VNVPPGSFSPVYVAFWSSVSVGGPLGLSARLAAGSACGQVISSHEAPQTTVDTKRDLLIVPPER